MSNPVYGKQAKRSIEVDKKPALLWLLIGAVVLFLAWSAFQAALFNGQLLDFEKPLLSAVAAACVILLIWVANYFKSFKLESQRDWLAVAVLLLPISYLLSLIGAASQTLAMNMVLIQCMYAALFIVGLFLLQNKQINRLIETAVMSIAYLVVWFGFLNWFGHGKLAGSLVGWFSNTVHIDTGIYTDAIMSDSNGLRLTSVFQYANTYAAFLMAFLFAAVFLLIRSKSWVGQVVHGFMLVPIIISILLTLSRGGLVMLPVVFVLLLLFLKPAKQILWVIYCGVAGVAALVISKTVTDLGIQLNAETASGSAAKGWGFLLLTSAIVALLSWVIQRYLAPALHNKLQGWSVKKLSNLWIPVGSVVLGGVLAFLLIGTSMKNILPENVSTRLENINFNQHSVLERFTFYKDATKLAKDYPVLGAGGGAWASLYEKYQNNPYTSRQAHNFFLQYLVEVGILGFLIFMSFIIFIFYKYIRAYIKESEENRESHFIYLILALSILLHSVLDFNMSYAFMGLLVFISLSGMAAVMDNKVLNRKLSGSGVKAAYHGVIAICAVVVFITSVRYAMASSAGMEARKIVKESSVYEEIKAPLDKDLKLRKNHPDSVLLLSSLYHEVYKQTQQEEAYIAAYDLVTGALEGEPYNKQLINRLIQTYELKGEYSQGFDLLVEKSEIFNWDISWHERIITNGFELGNIALSNQDLEAKDKYFNAGIAAFEKVQAGIQHLTTLPEGQMAGQPFDNTPAMIASAGKMYFLSNQPEKATETLAMGLQADLNDPTNREIARWYVAALQKQGSTDEAVFNQLIEVDPSEKDQIEQITAIKL